MGIFGIGYPEAYGGTPGDIFYKIAASEEILRSGSGGFAASLGSLDIAIPPILNLGTEDQKQKYVKPVLAGEKIAALGITEPGGGSDVANIQFERLTLAVMANMTAQMALEEAMTYAGEREAFGKSIKGFQVTRHKLVDMATLVEVSREFTYRVAARIDAGQDQTREVSMAKNFACSVSDKVTYDAVQIFGGYGFMRGYLVERLYRDNRILSIGGGTTEVMKEIISKLML